MMPWRPVIVFLVIAAGTTTAIAILCAAMLTLRRWGVTGAYVVLGGAVFLWMRWRGPSWQSLVGGAFRTSTA